MSEQGVSGPQTRSSDMQLTVQSSANASAVLEYEDPRKQPVEERLQQAEEHEEKLKHIMETLPIKIRHLQGSSAGAGSGEFHIYRNARNQEQKRVREMEARWKAEQKELFIKRKYEDAQTALDVKTAKNRSKRQKRKDKRHGKAVSNSTTARFAFDTETEAPKDPDLD